MKILIGCPTSDHKAYCLEEYVSMLKTLTGNSFDILLVDNSKTGNYSKTIAALNIPVERGPYVPEARERIIQSRNILRKKTLDEGYDYFFSLEQDVLPPADVIQRMLAHKKEIVTGVYFKDFTFRDQHGKVMQRAVMPLLYQHYSKDKEKQLTFDDVKENKLIEVSMSGLGCILIHRAVLEKVIFRYVKEKEPFDDIWFCKDARDQGYTIYADTSIKCKHLTKEMDWTKIKK